MQAINQIYRKDYAGEDVNVLGIYINERWQYQKEFIPSTFLNVPYSNRAVVIGNGLSRLQFDLKLILNHRDVAAWGETGPWKPALTTKKFNTYGCNAIYREYQPDFVVAVGDEIIDEIANNEYSTNFPVYANAWALLKYPGKFNFIPQDPVYNSGALAAYLAAFDGHKKVFMLGFDGIDSSNSNYNAFSGTPGYPIDSQNITEAFWVNALAEVMRVYAETEFIHVAPTMNFRIPELWKYLPNFRTIDFRKFVLEADI